MKYIITFISGGTEVGIDIYASCVCRNNDGKSILVNVTSIIVFPGEIVNIKREENSSEATNFN